MRVFSYLTICLLLVVCFSACKISGSKRIVYTDSGYPEISVQADVEEVIPVLQQEMSYHGYFLREEEPGKITFVKYFDPKDPIVNDLSGSLNYDLLPSIKIIVSYKQVGEYTELLAKGIVYPNSDEAPEINDITKENDAWFNDLYYLLQQVRYKNGIHL